MSVVLSCICAVCVCCILLSFFFFQAEDGIRDLVRSRGLGDVYKRQVLAAYQLEEARRQAVAKAQQALKAGGLQAVGPVTCLLYTSDAADERSSVDLGGRRIIKKKTKKSKAQIWHKQAKKWMRHKNTVIK